MADENPTPTRPTRRLDRRTLAICTVIALIGAIAAGLIASIALGNGDDASASDSLELVDSATGNPDRLLTTALETTDGESATLEALMGDKPALVNFWQSSCTPCVREMPLLEDVHQQRTDVDVIGIASQDRLAAATERAEETGISYPWVQDLEGNLYYEAGAVGMPTTVLLDTNGTILAQKTGAFDDEAEIQAFIDHNVG